MTLAADRHAPRARDVAGSSRSRTHRAVVVCDQWLGSNGYAGERALRRAGWGTIVVPEREFIPLRWTSLPMRVLGRAVRPLAVGEFNRALTRAAEATAPEFLLVFKGTFVQGETLDQLRAYGIRCYCFYPDVSFRTHGPYLPRALPKYDWVFTTKTFGLNDLREQLGIVDASLLHHAYDPDLHRPALLTEADWATYGCDVSFIGTWSPKKEALLRGLVERRPALAVRVWGEQWHRARGGSDFRRRIEGRGVHGDEYTRAIAASTINLGILSERRSGASSGLASMKRAMWATRKTP